MTRSNESALRALSLEYADAVRARDADRWGATWADDARWHLGPDRSVEGRTAIVELWVSAMAKYDTVIQQYLSATYDIDDHAGTASGCAQLLEFVVAVDDARTMMSGHYDDTYVRTDDGWRFASRELTMYYRGPSDLSGTFISAVRP